jgi:hypothetical protein
LKQQGKEENKIRRKSEYTGDWLKLAERSKENNGKCNAPGRNK